MNIDIITDVDGYYARAIYAYKTRSVRPEFNRSGKMNIINGRHPLIDKGKVVPVSLSFGDKYNYLLITGPNTGGKTVTLKLTGLFSLMTMSGFFVTASEGTEISYFDNIFCDVGDVQFAYKKHNRNNRKRRLFFALSYRRNRRGNGPGRRKRDRARGYRKSSR